MSTGPEGAIIAELRAANIASKRVRGYEPDDGDARGPGSYQRFVVVVDLGGAPVREIIHRKRILVRAYGATYQDAEALYGEIQDVLHLAGPRLPGNLKPIYNSRDDTGGSEHRDPDTGQPYYEGVFVVTHWIGPALTV